MCLLSLIRLGHVNVIFVTAADHPPTIDNIGFQTLQVQLMTKTQLPPLHPASKTSLGRNPLAQLRSSTWLENYQVTRGDVTR